MELDLTTGEKISVAPLPFALLVAIWPRAGWGPASLGCCKLADGLVVLAIDRSHLERGFASSWCVELVSCTPGRSGTRNALRAGYLPSSAAGAGWFLSGSYTSPVAQR